MTALDLALVSTLVQGLGVSVLVSSVFTLLLLGKSIFDFTRTGPHLTEEVLSHYRPYLAYSLGRLTFYTFVIAVFMAFLGTAVYGVGLVLSGAAYHSAAAATASVAAILVLTGRLFIRTLLLSPGVIASSSLYSMKHFYPLWERLTPGRLRLLDVTLFGALAGWLSAGLVLTAWDGAWAAFWLIGVVGSLYLLVPYLATRRSRPSPARSSRAQHAPNILLIGSDTLRADRLNGTGYRRDLTPNLDRLARHGARFTECYVPCARTAPSLVSMLTGTWPHTHGVRDTFVTPEETHLPVPALPDILRRAGYRSGIVGDWAASDAEKLSFGFEYMDLPPHQWNMKYLLRQGPKDIRLFLSLFTQNRFGKVCLPEIYYLGGHPLTEEIGHDTRRMISKLANKGAPFFLLSFMATTHPPFTSKYPYYALYSQREYRGESKFGMAKLQDPWEIIRRQGEPKSEFDLDQIIDLYDGCVKNFDDEVARVLEYLESSGLAQNTVVVIFSDHGFEFFEHDTWGQGNSAVSDFSARVPLIIADPRNLQPQTIMDVVRTIDVAPTLLELAGLEVPKQMEGVSLVPVMQGKELAAELPAFYETGVWLTDLPGAPETHLRYPELPELLEVPDKRLGMISLKAKYVPIIINAKDRMVRLGDWKLSYEPLTDGPSYRLFNIREDPGCQRNVLDQFPEVVTRLRALLEEWIAADTRMASGATSGAQPPDKLAGHPPAK